MAILDAAIAKLGKRKVIDGNTVFKLHDTYGFPTDLTADIARERGLAVDMEGYERAMDVQRRQSQAASQFGVDLVRRRRRSKARREFLGYETLASDAPVVALLDGRAQRVQALDSRRRGRRSCSTARRSMRRAAAKSAIPASFGRRRATSPSATRRKRGCRVRPSRQAVAAGRIAVGDALGASRREAPRRDRAQSLGHASCCTRRCAKCSARTCSRRARSSSRIACASTSRTSSPSAPSSSTRSKRSSTSRCA